MELSYFFLFMDIASVVSPMDVACDYSVCLEENVVFSLVDIGKKAKNFLRLYL